MNVLQKTKSKRTISSFQDNEDLSQSNSLSISS